MGFCDSGQSTTNKTQWVDPLGPTSISPQGKRQTYEPTGAPQIRSELFNYIRGARPGLIQSGETAATGLQRAAANPAWAQMQRNAGSAASGAYLHGSPELDRALAWNRASGRASAADETARLRSSYGRAGMSFSTGNQQASQAAQGAANARSEQTSAQALLQNYLAERSNQLSAADALAKAQGMPLNYLQGVTGAKLQPLAQIGNLLSALSSGGQVVQTGSNSSATPSAGGAILQGIGAL